jgi:hypothetical protein
MAKRLLAAMGVLLLGAGCMAGGSEETEETARDGTTATAAQSLCRQVCGRRCFRTLTGTRCQRQCWTQCR